MVYAMAKKRQGPEVRPELALVQFYRRNGYMRVPNEALREDAPREYKKGYEIRLIARSQRELTAMRRMIRQVDLRPGKPFPKHKQWVQPIYGRDAMDLFTTWLDLFAEEPEGKPQRNHGKQKIAIKSTPEKKAVARNSTPKKVAGPTARVKRAVPTASSKRTVGVTKAKKATRSSGTAKKASTIAKRKTRASSATSTNRGSRKVG